MSTLSYAIEREYATVDLALPTRPLPKSFEDQRIVERLRDRDEAAFTELVERHHSGLVRLARTFVNSWSVAEEVAQDTWMAVLRGIDGFEGRCSIKTWIFQILINRAKTRSVRESRVVNFSALGRENLDGSDLAVESTLPSGGPQDLGALPSQPAQWEMSPEQILMSRECRAQIESAIAGLPQSQKQVITLRDVQGWDIAEICALLGINERNCRVRLHRARTKVRQALGNYLKPRT